MSTIPRVALITGGARRVGRAIVERLADAGFDIAFSYLHSENQAMQLQEKLTAAGRRISAIRADLFDPETAVPHLAAEFGRHFDRLDVLVNNASIYEPSNLQSAGPDLRRNLWNIHVEAPFLLCRHFEQHLRDARGHVINMVDVLAERPWPEYLAYCASKAALLNLTLGLARGLAPQVTVNGIAPGVVDWPADVSEEQRHKYLRRVPLQRAGTPRDVAETVLFLASSAPYITGQIVALDGGRSLT